MTSTSDFLTQLTKRARSMGGEWVKADFHVHCPGSADYEYKEPDAMQRLGHALSEQEYRFAVVLKHEAFPTRDELQELQQSCPGVTLIPGAELNVFVDAMFKKVTKDHYFHCVLAVDPGMDGDYGYVLQLARNKFSYKPSEYPSGFRSSVLDLGRFFRKHGAVFLPAHLHQSKKPHESKSVDDIYEDDAFLSFIEEGAFTALEVRERPTADFFSGGRQTKQGRTIPKTVCVQSSDAHSHSHIAERKRLTWLRVEECTFHELSSAVAFPHRVSLDVPHVPDQRIIGMHITGAFLPDVWIRFNPCMNAFIGCKGSGKTSILECLRFLFGTPIPSDRTEAVKRHVAHILGSGGMVECLIQRQDGSRFVLVRRADAPQRLTVIDNKGASHEASSDERFDVAILGWHEIESVADNPTTRVQLLDGIKGGSEVRSCYERIEAHIRTARDNLPVFQQRLRRLSETMRERRDLSRKRATLTKLKKADLVDLQNRYEWFLGAGEKLRAHRDQILRHREGLVDLLPHEPSRSIAEDLGGPVPDGVVDSVQAAAAAVEALTEGDSASLKQLQNGGVDAVKAIEATVDLVEQKFSAFRDEVYNPKVDALPAEDREILTRQIQVLEETHALPKVEEECRTVHAEVVKLAGALENECKAVCTARDEVCAIRQSVIAELNKELDGVQLAFVRGGNPSRLAQYRQRYSSEGGTVVDLLQGYGKKEIYQNLSVLFETLRTSDIEAEEWRVADVMWDVHLVHFLDVFDDDDLQIALEVGNAGYVPIQNLSAGQRCTAVFPLLLRNARGPLVIDQPEDNLDNRHIADTIAPDLLTRKARQQYIVTSHNANLVVLADADLIIHMDSDGQKAWIQSAGFLACSDSSVRDSVVDVLDGGEEALEARRRKYGSHGSRTVTD